MNSNSIPWIKKWLWHSSGVVMLLISPVVYSGVALDQLESFIQDVETFEADFEQTLYDSNSEPLQKLIGTIQLKRPGKFVWTYFAPEEQQIVADGERIWMYDKDLEQVTVNTISDRIAGTPLVLLMRAAPLDDSFEIQELGSAEGINWVELTPKADSSDFEQVFIGLNADGLAAMELRDNFGQATQIIFTEFKTGVELSDSLFEFIVPDGVDVIGFDE
ncbi:MAG: outer membrane lipoprotein carrier protein [bacterium]|jgi:outer membrane lipoprotein carrier protein